VFCTTIISWPRDLEGLLIQRACKNSNCSSIEAWMLKNSKPSIAIQRIPSSQPGSVMDRRLPREILHAGSKNTTVFVVYLGGVSCIVRY
jgi:hypothetical protein